MAGLPVAVLDADVLVPILSCDLLLSSFDHGLYQPVVTRRILDEVTRSLAVDFPALDRPAIARRVRQVAVALAFNTEKEVAASEAVAGVNAKDRHVASAALAARADFVVTNDRRLRRQVDGIGEPLRALSADEFMVRLYRDQPDRLVGVLDAMVAKRTRRPISPSELVNALKSSFPQLVNRLTEAGHADP